MVLVDRRHDLGLVGPRDDGAAAAPRHHGQRRAPGAIAATVPAVGHAPTLDEPEARAAIDALLARCA